MMIYQEKIAPPLPIRLTDDEQMKVIAEAVAEEDRWVKDFIDRLAGLVRDLKHQRRVIEGISDHSFSAPVKSRRSNGQ
jgi:hypothetical protein